MKRDLYLTRVSLRRDSAAGALAPILLGQADHGSQSQQPGHHLMWYLFADSPDRRRDFLWRNMEKGVFLTLSERRPVDPHGFFEIEEPKLFTPILRAGDRLSFSLRANAVVRRKDPAKKRSVKHDVVMDMLRALPSGKRSEHRRDTILKAGLSWLARQSATAGFAFQSNEVTVEGYELHNISRRGRSTPPLRFSSIDFDGLFTVTDPEALMEAIQRGFGASKGFGCGLMLIRRAA